MSQTEFAPVDAVAGGIDPTRTLEQWSILELYGLDESR
jgi:hypothetical protein